MRKRTTTQPIMQCKSENDNTESQRRPHTPPHRPATPAAPAACCRSGHTHTPSLSAGALAVGVTRSDAEIEKMLAATHTHTHTHTRAGVLVFDVDAKHRLVNRRRCPARDTHTHTTFTLTLRRQCEAVSSEKPELLEGFEIIINGLVGLV